MQTLSRLLIGFAIVLFIPTASNAAEHKVKANCTMVAGPENGTIREFIIDLASGKMKIEGTMFAVRSQNEKILLSMPGANKAMMFFDLKSGEFHNAFIGKMGDCKFKNIASNAKSSNAKTEMTPYKKSRIYSCLVRLERYANLSKNIFQVPNQSETFQSDFSKGYLFAAIPEFYKQKEKFKSKNVKEKQQFNSVNLHIKTVNSWFDAMDCTRDLISYGIIESKLMK